MKFEEIKRLYNEKDPIVISDLMELLKTATPRMKGLKLVRFISEWINYYYIPSMLAIDNMEYLLFIMK